MVSDYVTIFEAQENTSSFAHLFVFGGLLGLIALFCFVRPLYLAIKDSKIGLRMFLKEKILILLLIFAIILSFASCAVINAGIENISFYRQLYQDYKQGNCDYVEGYICDFNPMPENTRGISETFTVNGIFFSYADESHNYYYSTCQKDGGKLREGMYVRMWYKNVDFGSEYPISYIMRIDVLRNLNTGGLIMCDYNG